MRHIFKMLGGGEQLPFTADGAQPPSLEAPRSADLFDLAENWLDGHASLGVDGAAPSGL
jgi:hypothetical protein